MQQLTRKSLTDAEVRSAILNGASTDARWVGQCLDCEEWSDDLMPYKYEPDNFLCEGCLEERMYDAN